MLYLSHVKNSSSRFGPPQQQDVTLATGISTFLSIAPETGLKLTTFIKGMRKTILLVINNKYRYNYNFSLYNEKPPNLGTVPVIIGSGIIIIIDKRKLFEIQIKKTCWLKYKETEI